MDGTTIRIATVIYIYIFIEYLNVYIEERKDIEFTLSVSCFKSSNQEKWKNFYLPAHRALPNAIHLYALAYKCKLTCPKIQRGGGGGGRGGNTLADYKGVTL